LVTSDKSFPQQTPEVEALKGKTTESEILNALIITESQGENCHIKLAKFLANIVYF